MHTGYEGEDARGKRKRKRCIFGEAIVKTSLARENLISFALIRCRHDLDGDPTTVNSVAKYTYEQFFLPCPSLLVCYDCALLSRC